MVRVFLPLNCIIIDIHTCQYRYTLSLAALGVCIPYNFTLPANTLWYWCGWSSTARSQYQVLGTTQSLSTLLMKNTAIQQCVLNVNKDPAMSLSYVKNCEQVMFSLSDTIAKNVTAVLRIQGLAFDDNVCLVIANNNPSSTGVQVQFYQWPDSARYYGTVFSVILTVLGLAALTTHMGYHIYLVITTSPDRIKELKELEAELNETVYVEEKPLAGTGKSTLWQKISTSWKINQICQDKKAVGIVEYGRQ